MGRLAAQAHPIVRTPYVRGFAYALGHFNIEYLGLLNLSKGVVNQMDRWFFTGYYHSLSHPVRTYLGRELNARD